jgi:hypothetical protein
MWTASYLMQTTAYNNHYYLIILLCLLLLPTPAHADLSYDAKHDPRIRSRTCPRWCSLVFVAQMAIVYFFATIPKLYPDWLAAKPLGIWLTERTHYPIIGGLYAQPWLKWVLAYGGILFDGLVVPLLLWQRTRLIALGLALVFHLFNSITFQIGIFPYLALSLCIFFFPPERVRDAFARLMRSSVFSRLRIPPVEETVDLLRSGPSRRRHNTAAPQGERRESSGINNDTAQAEEAPLLRGRLEACPELRRRAPFAHLSTVPRSGRSEESSAPAGHRGLLLAFLGVFFLLQIVLPLRHFLYPGNVHWTEEGHRMAWHMMLRTKSGRIHYIVKDPASGESWKVDPADYLAPKQSERIATRPDMIWQFAQRLAREYRDKGRPTVEVYAFTRVSLNGRPYQPLVNSKVDLAKAEWTWFRPLDWLVPLKE